MKDENDMLMQKLNEEVSTKKLSLINKAIELYIQEATEDGLSVVLLPTQFASNEDFDCTDDLIEIINKLNQPKKTAKK